MGSGFDRVLKFFQLISYIVAPIGICVGLYQLNNHINDVNEANRRIELETYQQAYHEVDAMYIAFLQLCIQYPKTDCYSVGATSNTAPPLSDEEKAQQRVLYTMLTDVFEVTYIQYRGNHFTFAPELKDIRENQWKGWEAYIRKFLDRPAYCAVYLEIRDEYDPRLTAFIDSLGKCRSHSAENSQ
jgi:hypothetical protein